jgi:hypothetical protein
MCNEKSGKNRLTSADDACFSSGMLHRHTPALDASAVATGNALALVLVLITSPTGAGRTGV